MKIIFYHRKNADHVVEDLFLQKFPTNVGCHKNQEYAVLTFEGISTTSRQECVSGLCMGDARAMLTTSMTYIPASWSAIQVHWFPHSARNPKIEEPVRLISHDFTSTQMHIVVRNSATRVVVEMTTTFLLLKLAKGFADHEPENN